MIVSDPLQRLLDHLAATLDSRRQAAIDERYRRTLDYASVDRPPCIELGALPHDAPFTPVPHRQIFSDPQKMLYNELVNAFDTSIAMRDRIADDLPLTARANFGTVLIASQFGAPVEQVEDNPPWVRHQADGNDTLRRVCDTDPQDSNRGWVPCAVKTMQCFHDILQGWPEVRRQLQIVLRHVVGWSPDRPTSCREWAGRETSAVDAPRFAGGRVGRPAHNRGVAGILAPTLGQAG